MRTKVMLIVGTALVAVLIFAGVALAATFAVTKTAPKSGATGIATTANVKAFFNHNVMKSTVNSSTFKIRKQGTTSWLPAQRTVNNTITATSTNGGSESVATLNPDANLESNTTYQVVVVGGSSGVKDATGAALSANKSWTFTTAVATAPPPETTITSYPPDPDKSTSATFEFASSEPGSTFQCALDDPSAYSPCTSPKTVPDSGSLADGTHTFYVKATGAAGNNTDPTAATYTWTVQSIVDTVAPTVINGTPAHQTTGVAPSTNVTATFSEDMDPVSISGQTFKLFGAGSPVTAQVTYDQASRTATLNPAQDLEAGATYVAKIIKNVHNQSTNIDGVTDLAGNTINEDKTWYFTVEAPSGVVTAAPKTLNLSPDVWCFPRQEWLTVTNNTPAPVTFAAVSITGPDAAYFSDNATGLVFQVARGNYFIDPVTFRPGSTITDRHRAYQATLTYKDSTGATIGNSVELRATTSCITVG